MGKDRVAGCIRRHPLNSPNPKSRSIAVAVLRLMRIALANFDGESQIAKWRIEPL